MARKRHTYQHSETKKPTTPVPQTQEQGMFRSRPFGLESEPIAPPPQPLDLKTELMRAQRYGHNLTQMQWAGSAPVTSVQPKKRRGQPLPSQPQTEPLLQAKLTIGEPADKYEKEADTVASQVVQQINAPNPQQSTQSQSVQREATADDEELMKKSERGTIQREEEPKEDEELQMKPAVQLQASEGAMAATDELESNIQRARGGGQVLADNVREPLEQAFGADFSGVKVHTDSQADQLNRATQARAFTTGQDVFFREGEYQPRSRGGQELLAHELTHVVQQGKRGTLEQNKVQRMLEFSVHSQARGGSLKLDGNTREIRKKAQEIINRGTDEELNNAIRTIQNSLVNRQQESQSHKGKGNAQSDSKKTHEHRIGIEQGILTSLEDEQQKRQQKKAERNLEAQQTEEANKSLYEELKEKNQGQDYQEGWADSKNREGYQRWKAEGCPQDLNKWK